MVLKYVVTVLNSELSAEQQLIIWDGIMTTTCRACKPCADLNHTKPETAQVPQSKQDAGGPCTASSH